MMRKFWFRYWSLIAVVLLPVAEICVERSSIDYENSRAGMAILCLLLLTYSWCVQWKNARDLWKKTGWTLVHLMLAMGPLWLGLNVIRAYTYDYAADYERNKGSFLQHLNWFAVENQDRILGIVKIDAFLIAFWALVSLIKNKSGSSNSGSAR